MLYAISVSLQNIVSKNAMQYRGNAQHDAQEFLLWLLDRVHEDLNNVVNYSGMPPLKVRDFAGSQHGRVAVTLHAVFLFKLDLPVGFSTLTVWMEQKLGLKYCLFLALRI